MWLVRFITVVLLLVPFLVQDGEPLMTALLFFPAIACSIAVAHQASDHEDEETTDFVTPVFWIALRESSWVLPALTLLIGRSPHMGWEDGFLDSLSLLAPSAVFALAGCHIGVLFTRESMSREAEAFGAAALTTAYLVVATTGLYYLLYSPIADRVWPMPFAIVLVAAVPRVLARFLAGPIKIGNTWPLTVVSAVMVGWTVLVFPLIHGVIQKKGTTHLSGCTGNLRRISTALEMYSVNWSGRFPPDPDNIGGYLVPNYLESMPICPSSERTYSFEIGPDTPSNELGNPNYYFIFCPGENHSRADCPADYPRYSSQEGLTLR